MSEEKGLVPRLRFPEFREAGAWEENQLGRIGNFTGGGTPSKSNGSFWRGRIPWVSSSDISEESIHEVKISRFITDEALESSATRLVPAGSILLVSRVGVGKLAITKSSVCTSQDFTNLTPYRDDLEFLAYLLKANSRVLEGLGQGMAIKGFTKDDVSKLAVHLPALMEQQKIADCLSSLDALIAAQADKLDALKTHKEGLMQRLFPREGETVPRLRFPEFREAGEWQQSNLDQLVNLRSGGTPSKANPAFWNGSIPWVSAKDMKQLFLEDTEDHISTAAVDEGAKLVPAGTLLMLTRGMTLLKDIPICVLRRKMSFNQDVKALRPTTDGDGLFLALLLLGNKQRLLKMVDIAGHGTGRLDTDELKALELLLPQPAEQHEIANCLSSLDALIAAQTDKLDALKTHKQGLMQQLFPSPGAVAA